jgi:hypothetical protein
VVPRTRLVCGLAIIALAAAVEVGIVFALSTPPVHQSTVRALANMPTKNLVARFSATEAPLPAGASTDPKVSLNAVTCTSVKSCVAVGNYVDASGRTQGLLDTKSAASWTAIKAPLPQGARLGSQGAGLYSVACPSSSRCIAVGDYFNSSGHDQALMVIGSGSSWTARNVPLPADPGTTPIYSLISVACPSPSKCVAVGSYSSSSYDGGLLVTEYGSSWTARKAPVPANASADSSATLNAVACSAASACVAVGYYFDSSQNTQGLLLTESGSTWTATEAPAPLDAESGTTLIAVACALKHGCVAVGGYHQAAAPLPQDTQGMLVTRLGSSWVTTRIGVSPDVSAEAAACDSSEAVCVAVGQYTDPAGHEQGLVLAGSGSSWSASRAPEPANADANPGGGLSAVTCPSESACVAVGLYTDESGREQGLVLAVSGSSWAAIRTPVPPYAAANPDVSLDSVSCRSELTCVAVGSYVDSSGRQQGLLLTE